MSKFLRNKNFMVLRQQEIIKFLENKGYSTWGEIKTQLGMGKKMLKKALRNVELSVSLNSKRQFFTLRKLAKSNENFDYPIWITDGKVFSSVGNLQETVLHIVLHAPDGIDDKTLSSILKTPTRNVLKKLKDKKRIRAVSFEGRNVYFTSSKRIFAKKFSKRLAKENCDDIQISLEEFLKNIDPEIKHIAKEFIPKGLIESGNLNYKEFVKLLITEPKIAESSDRHMARLLNNSSRIRKLIRTKIRGHSTISKYKDLLTVEFYVKMFEYLVEKVIEFTKIKEVTILVDATVNNRYKRDNTHFRCHTATIAELKCPIAMIVTGGKVHESPVFERLLSKIEKLKVKIKYVICDAGYDAARIFVRVSKRLKALAIIPTRDMKKGNRDSDTFQLSLDYYFEEIYKNDVFELVQKHDEAKAGSRIREMVDAVKKLSWWKEIYKVRTGVERFFSWVKSSLGLTKPNGYSLKQVARHAYQIFSFTVAQCLCALKLGITNKTASFKSFII